MSSNKRTVETIQKVPIEDIEWNQKDHLFKNVYSNYNDLCQLYSTPVSIFNTNLLQLNEIEKKKDYSNFDLEFYNCNQEHISTIKVRSINSSNYDASKTNIKCKECGTKTTNKLVTNLTDAVKSKRFNLTDQELNKIVSEFKSTPWLSIRKQYFNFPCGICNNKSSVSAYTIESGKFQDCTSCNSGITHTSVISNLKNYLTENNSTVDMNQLKIFQESLSNSRVLDYPTITIDITQRCGHSMKFNANQFVKKIESNWICDQCVSPQSRSNLIDGILSLYEMGFISNAQYQLENHKAKKLDTDGVSQFKMNIFIQECGHSKQLVGSQICKLSDSHLECIECNKGEMVSNKIIDGINFHIKEKSFTIDNYNELVQQILKLDSYSIQSFEFNVNLKCGHTHGIKNSFMYYNSDKSVDFICQICNPQNSAKSILSLLDSYMKKNKLQFHIEDETKDTILTQPIQTIVNYSVSLCHKPCGHYYGFKLSSLKFEKFYSTTFNCKECNLDVTLYENIKLLLSKYSALVPKMNLSQIKNRITLSENIRLLNFYFTMFCGHEICISGNHLINYKSITPRCPECKPEYKNLMEFSFYGFKKINVEHSLPEMMCSSGHIIINPSKMICPLCNVGGRFYETIIIGAINGYLKSGHLSKYVQMLGPFHYSFSDITGYYDFSLRFKLDNSGKLLSKIDSNDQTDTTVTLNYEVDEFHHFSNFKTIIRDAKKNYYHATNRGNNLVRISYKFIDEIFYCYDVKKAVANLVDCSIYSIINNKEQVMVSDASYEELECFKNKQFKYFNLFDLFEFQNEFPLENWSLSFDITHFLKNLNTTSSNL